MKNIWLIALVLLALGSVVASRLLPAQHEQWQAQPGQSLVLSLKGSSRNVETSRLEIRCDGGKVEARLYAPIGIEQPSGAPGSGPPELSLNESFLDKNRRALPASDELYPNVWTVDPSQTYAAANDPKAFLARIRDKDWVALNSAAFGMPPRAITMEFPVMGFGDYRDRVVAACRI